MPTGLNAVGEVGQLLFADCCVSAASECVGADVHESEVEQEMLCLDDQEEEESKDCCSDDCCGEGVCLCSSCHISLFIVASLDFYAFNNIPESDLWDFFENPLSNGQNFSIWQPPRFIS